ncbi:hypothetical protein ES677_01510 [Bizionia gelidisalsuginis]|uniref:Type I restriction modification DNA specificity domain-containing protein n=1 Tax=Bizionia gelidisalsuginis TaxID=291188 RepID=A0ABY3MER5_9FLAO|nr:restriction endonuclease subunit S [Bizionia gelidisalsuginis]TYC18083.1 hypothetical protein ES677_01510 [Bizionia gelidisalsuginis]
MIKELTMEKASLPDGWEMKTLGEVCDLKSGKTISKSIERSEGEILYIKVGDMNLKGNENYIQVSNRFVDEIDIKANQIIPIGSIIFPKRGGAIATNKKRRIVKPTIVDLNTMALVPSKIINKDYLFHWFQKIDLAELSNGANIPQINNYSFDNVLISFPKSLTQQKQIVALLDKAFTAIATAKANAQQNLQNAKELFESYLQNVFENKGDDWEEKTLEQISESIFAGGDKPKDAFSKEVTTEYNVPIFANAVKKRGLYGYTNKARVLKPSVTISARGSGTGHTELRKMKYYPIVRLIVVIPNSEIMDLQFLKHSIDNLDILRSGSAIPQLTVPMMKEYKLAFPKIEKQKQIVNKLDILSAETKKLEAIYTQKIADLEEMKKSVLQKAFSGQLL